MPGPISFFKGAGEASREDTRGPCASPLPGLGLRVWREEARAVGRGRGGRG